MGGDFLSNHDLVDVLTIVDGVDELAGEMRKAPPDLRATVAAALGQLLSNPDFANVLPGLLAEPKRIGLVRIG